MQPGRASRTLRPSSAQMSSDRAPPTTRMSVVEPVTATRAPSARLCPETNVSLVEPVVARAAMVMPARRAHSTACALRTRAPCSASACISS